MRLRKGNRTKNLDHSPPYRQSLLKTYEGQGHINTSESHISAAHQLSLKETKFGNIFRSIWTKPLGSRLQDMYSRGSYRVQGRYSGTNRGTNRGPTEGQPRGNRGATEGQPRGNRGATEGQPRGNRGATEGQPRGNRGTTEGQPRDNFLPNQQHKSF